MQSGGGLKISSVVNRPLGREGGVGGGGGKGQKNVHAKRKTMRVPVSRVTAI